MSARDAVAAAAAGGSVGGAGPAEASGLVTSPGIEDGLEGGKEAGPAPSRPNIVASNSTPIEAVSRYALSKVSCVEFN